MQLSPEVHIPDGLLAANWLLAENSRQGVPTSTLALHQGFGFRISSTAMDFQFRCSGIVSGTVVAPSKPKTLQSCLSQAWNEHGNGTALTLDGISIGLTLAAPEATVGVSLVQTLLGAAGAYNSFNQGVTASNFAAGAVSLGGASVSTITPSAKFFAGASSFTKSLGRVGGALTILSTGNDVNNYINDVSACMKP
jgi:hypothetical protein